MVQARNIAVMTGVNAGITCVMKRVRGKEDVQSRQVFAMPHLSPLILYCDFINSLSLLLYSYQELELVHVVLLVPNSQVIST